MATYCLKVVCHFSISKSGFSSLSSSSLTSPYLFLALLMSMLKSISLIMALIFLLFRQKKSGSGKLTSLPLIFVIRPVMHRMSKSLPIFLLLLVG